jgi:hypothetical protein
MGGLAEANNDILGITSGICLLAHSILFAHVWLGTRNMWVIYVTVLLFICNIGGVGVAYYYGRIVTHQHKTLSNVYGLEISNTILLNLSFNVAMYLLATKYLEIARMIPYKFSKQPVPSASQCRTLTLVLLLLANIACPILQFFAGVSYRTTRWIDNQEPTAY